jgi:hypothetical protein
LIGGWRRSPVSHQTSEIAAGLGRFLHPFALKLGASPYWNWNRDGLTALPTQTLRTFELAFREASRNCKTIHFNLDGIRDPVRSANRGQSSGFVAGNLTNAELNAIRSEKELLAKTLFYRNDAVVGSPFP